MNYYLDVWRGYFDFSGRARRKEYWYFTLYHAIATVLGELVAVTSFSDKSPLDVVFTAIFLLYFFASIIPSVAVTVRRLHDVDKSGWWYYIAFIPVIGAIWMLVLMCTDGTKGPNQYGPDPKMVEASAPI